LCSNGASFRKYAGPKRCGGYHPDWCLQWKDGDNVYQVLICFGCHKARLYGPKYEQWTDLTSESFKEFAEVLKPYRKNRPEPETDK
ncbi:MAG TPA: hypothetical protein VGG61_16255, partial [Gemmataceae bacterium]